MSDFPREKEESLLSILGRERELFAELLETLGEQAGLIAADDIEAFDKALEKGRNITQKVDGLHQETSLLMQSYALYSNSGDNRESDAVETLTGQIRDITAKCAELNEKITAEAKNKAAQYTQEINRLNLSRKSIGLYAQGVTNNPEHFDRRS